MKHLKQLATYVAASLCLGLALTAQDEACVCSTLAEQPIICTKVQQPSRLEQFVEELAQVKGQDY